MCQINQTEGNFLIEGRIIDKNYHEYFQIDDDDQGFYFLMYHLFYQYEYCYWVSNFFRFLDLEKNRKRNDELSEFLKNEQMIKIRAVLEVDYNQLKLFEFFMIFTDKDQLNLFEHFNFMKFKIKEKKYEYVQLYHNNTNVIFTDSFVPVDDMRIYNDILSRWKKLTSKIIGFYLPLCGLDNHIKLMIQNYQKEKE